MSVVVATAEELADLVRRVEELERSRLTRSEPWRNVEQAADYLACPRSRIYDLVRLGKLRHAKEGARLVFRREWLDDVPAGR